MKTAEQILEQVANLREPYYLNDVVIVKHALEAMQLYSDQQNKELKRIIDEYKQIWLPIDKLVRPDTPLGERVSKRALELLQQSKDKDAEIQRLTKEVEDSKVRLKQAVEFAGTKGGENTRLRELLVRSIDFIDRSKTLGVWDEAKQLLTDIDNELNHKP